MNQITENYIKSFLNEIIFWFALLMIYYFIFKLNLLYGIFFVIFISSILALLEAYKSIGNKKLNYYLLGLQTIIILTLGAASLVLMVYYLQSKIYSVFLVYFISTFIFYFRYDRLYHPPHD